tara:strand:+ start:11637 stop:11876 length:240 start_codon:yes stop_codon:yes gene_type:complete
MNDCEHIDALVTGECLSCGEYFDETLLAELKTLKAENAKLTSALRKAGGLAEINGWEKRYPLVWGELVEAAWQEKADDS